MIEVRPSLCFGAAVSLGVAFFAADRASATEAVAGRYIPGLYATPGAGIVPPVPGLYWGVSNAFYHGKADGAVPFGDATIALGLEADMWITALAAVYVPEVDLPGNWTYAFQADVPVGWTRAKATLGPREVEQEVTGLGDIAIAPVVLGWHNNELDTFFSASLTVTAPTGEWEEGDIAFIGLNYWTFTPAVAFTRLIPQQGIDISARFGIDINTRNPDTDYYSGAMAHFDLAVTKNVTERFALGLLAGYLYQFEDDDSAFADARNGFKGRSVAVGPLLTYKAKFSETQEVNFALRWAHEVEVENRMKGNALFFELTGKF